ncbi:hypothetical protein N657DRAFT_681165 [Parathielavia appendiculata]|uniref:Uncharacterized protein n=1 Tax=Parathielavia appendiculata TaxID=2587402 RepID=A0AAN6TYJ7_9PEZI|nr:hypothetical protein N657DRAFT_681165 [Parathielavia appendiculata]
MRAEESRDLHAMPLLRQLVAQIVSHLFSPEHATVALEARTGATSPCDHRLPTVTIYHADSCAVRKQEADHRLMTLDDGIHKSRPTVAVSLIAVYLFLLQ